MTTVLEAVPTGGPPGPTGPRRDRFAACLDAVSNALAEVADAPGWSLDDDAVDDHLERALRASAQLEELTARLTAEAVGRGLPDHGGATSARAWLMSRHRLSAGAASRLCAHAAATAPRHEVTRRAWAAGAVRGEQAAQIAEAVAALPGGLPTSETDRAQADLVAHAGVLTYTELGLVCRHLVEVIDPDGADAALGARLEAEERRARELTSLRLRRIGDGTSRLTARMPDLYADMLRTALQSLTSPRRAGAEGGGSAGTAMTGGTAVDSDVAGAEDDPEGGAGLPSAGGLGGGEGLPSAIYPGSVAGLPSGSSPVGGAGLPSAGRQDCGTDAPEPGRSGPTDNALGGALADPGGHQPAHRLGLALCELIGHLPADRLPRHGAANATVVVTVDLHTLQRGMGAATLSTGTEISAGEARRLACTADLVPAVLGGPSRVLDVGGARRLFSPPQRIALAVSDRGCVWPGCDRPPAWCEAHHLDPWSAGGPTNLANGCLLCSHHHHLVHHGWTVHRGADGIPELIPPLEVDPLQRPLRHHRFRSPVAQAPPP